MRGRKENLIGETPFKRRPLRLDGLLFAMHVLISTMMNGYDVTNWRLWWTVCKCRARSVNVSRIRLL